MGAWGYESSACDDCWDWLYAKDIHQMTQKEANETIHKILALKAKSDNYHKIVIGVVTHILYQELTVSTEALKLALRCCKKLLKNNNEGYDEPSQRLQCLKDEKAAIEKALKNGGKGEQQHVQGLLERIAIFLEKPR